MWTWRYVKRYLHPMELVLTRPTGVELCAAERLAHTSGMRVRLPVVDEFTGAVDWAPDFRAVSDPWLEDLEGKMYVRVSTEQAWYAWKSVHTTPWPKESAAWPARLVMVELSAR